jgi:hypothetical protein
MPYKIGTEIRCTGSVRTIAFTGKAVVITRKVGGGKRIPIGAIASFYLDDPRPRQRTRRAQ